VGKPAVGAVSMATSAPIFNAFLDRFFDAYYKRRPVNATFIGVHDYDSFLPDLSDNAAGDTLAEMKSMLQELDSLPHESLNQAEKIDCKLIAGYSFSSWESMFLYR
jgi:uncharacterized protein (DUF885 family)